MWNVEFSHISYRLNHAEIQFVDVFNLFLVALVDKCFFCQGNGGEFHLGTRKEEESGGAVEKEAVILRGSTAVAEREYINLVSDGGS